MESEFVFKNLDWRRGSKLRISQHSLSRSDRRMLRKEELEIHERWDTAIGISDEVLDSILFPPDRPFRRLLREPMYTTKGGIEHTRADLLATYYIQTGTNLEDREESVVPIIPRLPLFLGTRITTQGEFQGDTTGCFAGGRVTKLSVVTPETYLSITSHIAPAVAILVDVEKVKIMKRIGRWGEVQRGFILATSQATLDAINIHEEGHPLLSQRDIENIFYVVHNRGIIKTFFAPSWS